MAKRRKATPARKPREAQVEEPSLLLRSAESLGRVIGALQRQLDDATRQLGNGADRSRTRANGSDGKGTSKVRKKKPATKRKRTTH